MRWLAVMLVCPLVACGGGGGAGTGDGDAGPADDAAPADDATADGGGDTGVPLEDAGAPDTGDERLGPPYPVVLAHGFFGFEEFAGVDFATYYFEVKQDLASRGETLVFTPAVDPFNDSTDRGMQLLEEIKAILEETGHAKANIVGHSQGGLDARVVAHERPDIVASVTGIAAPHGGTPIADIVLRLVENDDFAAIVDALVRVIGAPIYDEAGEETSVVEGLRQFSEPGIMEFNETYTDQPGVAYYSLTGRTDRHPGGAPCEAEDRPPFITKWDDERDPVDPLLDITEQILDGGAFSSDPNDGLVLVEDSKHGRFLGCIPADHLDEIGQLFGDDPGLFNDFDHKQFFADLVAWLRAQGH